MAVNLMSREHVEQFILFLDEWAVELWCRDEPSNLPLFGSVVLHIVLMVP
jgi:hypothetical protein